MLKVNVDPGRDAYCKLTRAAATFYDVVLP